MKRNYFYLTALCGLLFLFTNNTPAQNSPSGTEASGKAVLKTAAEKPEKSATSEASAANSDVEILKRRLEEVENQNRLLLQMVTELKARFEAADLIESKKQLQPTVATGQPTTTALTTQTASSTSAALSTNPGSQSSTANQSTASQPLRWSDVVSEGNKLKFYGFLRLDMDFDSQRPNIGQTPLFITSPDPNSGGAEKGNYSMHPRLTRFGVDYTASNIESLGNAKLSGKLETDFENGGSESRQIIRIRHAFMRLDWHDFSLLAGQTWDIVSPLFPTVNNDTLQWNAGNVGDRRPQLRAAFEPKVGRGNLSLAGGLGLTGAIDALDLDNNGFRDGEESSLPNYQGRVGYSYTLGKDRNASFGVSGFYGFLETSRPIAGRTDFHSQLLNVDFTLPFAERLALRGEGWWGRNMSDIRGGAGQGINTANGREIRGRGGWAEATVKVSRFLSINPGFSTDDPVDQDLPNGGRTRNQSYYVANRINLAKNFLIGADYLRWLTTFKGFRRGVDNRVNLFLQYSF
jgi:hypothetical protein